MCSLLLACAVISKPSFGASIGSIQGTIERDAWKDKRPAGTPDPVDDSGTKCRYSENLKHTIQTLGNQTWYDWFSSKGNKGGKFKTAYDVVRDWEKNSAGTRLAPAVTQLASDLKGEALSFPELLMQIHLGIASVAVSDDVKSLLSAGFLFPLLNPSRNLPPFSERLDHLSNFVRHLEGPMMGGLGNLTFNELFYTPADPAHFSDSMLQMIVNAQYAGLIPLPEMDCTDDSSVPHAYFEADRYDPSVIIPMMLAVNKCCCRTSRKCDGVYPAANCNTCANTLCCLAGVTWCPTSICP
jgi:hypothetical protein